MKALLLPGLAPSNAAAVGEFMRADPYCRDRLAEADDVLGYDLAGCLRDSGRADDEYAQLAFLVNTLALADRARDRLGVAPAVCLGPSFGLYAAMVVTGVLPYPDVLRLVSAGARGERDFLGGPDAEVVTYYLFRTPDAVLADIVAAMSARGEWAEIAGRFGDDFSAVSMPSASIANFTDAVRERGGVPLYRMSPPVHCSRLGWVRDRLVETCASLHFADPALPIVSELDGTLVRTGGGVRELLLDGVVRPVCWPHAVSTLQRLGVDTIHVPGPSNLFDRLVRRQFTTVTVSPESALRDESISTGLIR